MIAAAPLALLTAVAAAASGPSPGAERAPRLPAHVDVRYRVEIAGEHAGWARLRLDCDAVRCEASWESALRTPDVVGAGAPGAAPGVVSRWIAVEALPTGTATRVAVRSSADGRTRSARRGGGAVPACLAEILLASTDEGTRRCLEIEDEESGRRGLACARRRGRWLVGDIAGEPLRFVAAPGGAPSEVIVPAQGARFVADEGAGLPSRAPVLFGAEVPLRPGRTPCGLAPDGLPPWLSPEVPRRFPPGHSCRERTALYLELLARAGLRGRHALGVAHDGRGLVWHEWAEVFVGGRWVAVDPSFGQAPAEGPRFTLARYEDGDATARADAGRKVLACWSAAAR